MWNIFLHLLVAIILSNKTHFHNIFQPRDSDTYTFRSHPVWCNNILHFDMDYPYKVHLKPNFLSHIIFKLKTDVHSSFLYNFGFHTGIYIFHLISRHKSHRFYKDCPHSHISHYENHTSCNLKS